MADINNQMIAVSTDVKAQLQPFYKIIDESSRITSDTRNGYSLTYRLPFVL